MPKLTIDGQDIEVEAGTSIIQAAEMLGIEIPRFCYHDRLSVPANCRMCLVEVEGGPPKPQASCALACADGMVVRTESDMVKKARKGVMEFLLINHPLDCPICDQGGECDLQDQAVAYGFDRSRYQENKRAVPEKDFGPIIKTIMTRCIQCTRCIRFADEVAGVPELGLLHRGENVEIDTAVGQMVDTELAGNLVDICPVGALTSAPYAFAARPWELSKTESIDVMDAVGSNIRVDSRGREVMRVLPRLHEEINEEWINDKTRYACDGLARQRLDRPYIRNGKKGALQPASWGQAFSAIAQQLKGMDGQHIAGIVGDQCDIESMVAFKDLLGKLNSPHMDCRQDGALFDVTMPSGYLFNSGISGIEDADAILLIGTNPRVEATMVNARIRKAWLHDRTKIALIGEPVDLGYPHEHIGKAPADIESLVAGKGAFAKILKAAKRPMVILGMGALQRSDGAAVQALAGKLAEKYEMVRDDWNGFNLLHLAASRVGALNIGFVPQKGGTAFAAILKESQKKTGIKVLYLLGADDFDMNQIGKNCFVVYQGHHGDAGAERADVILPGAAYTEKTGLYANMEGRVQLGKQAVAPPGEAREDWKIFRALSETLGLTLPYNTLYELRERVFDDWPRMGELDIKPYYEWQKLTSKDKLNKSAFKNPVENFYMTDPISRASKTMMNCTRYRYEAQGKLQEAAE